MLLVIYRQHIRTAKPVGVAVVQPTNKLPITLKERREHIMLTIKDIVDLAKAGYKPADVKELMELSKSNNDTSSEAAPADTESETPEKNPQIDPPAGVAEDEKEEPDYKSLYESTKKELEKAQKANIKTDISSEDDYISDSDIIKDLIKDFM